MTSRNLEAAALATARTGHDDPEGPCWFCDDSVRADKPAGGWAYEDSRWRVGHAPASYGPAGLVVLESRRHFLDAAKMTPDEAASFGPLLGRVIGAIKQSTGATRVYIFSTMAQYPHFHAMLIPWSEEQERRGPDYLNHLPVCTDEEAERTAAHIRILLSSAPPTSVDRQGVLVVIEHEPGIVLVLPPGGPSEAPASLPGGLVEDGESTEDAARRIARELTGLEIHLDRQITRFVQRGTPFGTVDDVVFLARSVGGSLSSDGPEGQALAFRTDDMPRIMPVRVANQRALDAYLASL